MDKNINILQLIKNGDINISNEVSNLKAKKKVNIKIVQFFITSPDLKKIKKKISQISIEVEKCKDSNYKIFLLNKLESLIKLEHEFKISILKMGDTFSKLSISTNRIKKAFALFNIGKFKEADKILLETDLSNNQFDLLIQVEYLEKRRDSYFNEF